MSAVQAQPLLCRGCGAFRPRREFLVGDPFCRMCRGMCGGSLSGEPAERFVSVADRASRPAIRSHEAELDRVLASLMFDGGMFSVQIGVAEAVKRLALQHRDRLAAQGWIV